MLNGYQLLLGILLLELASSAAAQKPKPAVSAQIATPNPAPVAKPVLSPEPTLTVTASAIRTEYHCFVSPSGFYGAGFIYQVFSGGKSSKVADLVQKKLLKVDSRAAEMPSLTSKSALSTDLTLSLTGLKAATVQAGGKAGGTGNTYVEYAGLTNDVIMENKAVDAAQGWVRDNPKAIKDAGRTFVVEDAYVAGSMTLDVSSDFVGSLGGELVLAKMLGSLGGDLVKGNTSSSFLMKRTFQSRLNVCIKASEVFISPGGSGVDVVSTEPVKPGKHPEVTSIDLSDPS